MLLGEVVTQINNDETEDNKKESGDVDYYKTQEDTEPQEHFGEEIYNV
jgi:hypothetical protein